MMLKKLSLTILLANILCVPAFSSENDEGKEGSPAKKTQLNESEEQAPPSSSSQTLKNAPTRPLAVLPTKREKINYYSTIYLGENSRLSKATDKSSR